MPEKRELRICRNDLCKVDYPHHHTRSLNGNQNWRPTIDDPPVSAPWPDRLQWKRPGMFNGRNPYRLFQFGWFVSHSGFQLPWKLSLDGLGFRGDADDSDWADVAQLVAGKFAFKSVYGIPRGGSEFARALDRYAEPKSDFPVLIVDDVLTTGRSFIVAKAALGNPERCIGVVVCARGRCPDWVFPILSVNEWAQSRATGLG